MADSEDIGHQVAAELGVDYHEYIGDSIYVWIQEERWSGYRASVLQWMNLGKRPAVEGIDLFENSNPEPPKGERQQPLFDEGSLAQAREEPLQSCKAEHCDAPVLAKGSLDPEGARDSRAGCSRLGPPVAQAVCHPEPPLAKHTTSHTS